MPGPTKVRAPVFRGFSRVLVPAEAEDVEEQVDPVQVDRQRDVDRVVERARHVHRPVPVVDDHRREEHHAEPINQRERPTDVEADVAGDRDDEQAADQDQQTTEQPGPPTREVLRDQRTNS